MNMAPAPPRKAPPTAVRLGETCAPACGTVKRFPPLRATLLHRVSTVNALRSTVHELLQPSELRKHINVFHIPEEFYRMGFASTCLHHGGRGGGGRGGGDPRYGRVVVGVVVVVVGRPPRRPRPGRSLPGWVGRT